MLMSDVWVAFRECVISTIVSHVIFIVFRCKIKTEWRDRANNILSLKMAWHKTKLINDKMKGNNPRMLYNLVHDIKKQV